MKTFGERLKASLRSSGMTQKQLADDLGVTQQSVNSACSPKAKRSKLSLRMAEIMNVDAGWLSHGVGEMYPKKALHEPTLSPKIGDQFLLATGAAEIKWEEIGNEAARKAAKVIACPIPHSANTYATKVMDESMTAPHGTTYPKGAMIFIDPERAHEAKAGDRVIAQLKGGHITFRQLNEFDGKQCLQALNTSLSIPPTYAPFKILGLIIGAWLTEQQLDKE